MTSRCLSAFHAMVLAGASAFLALPCLSFADEAPAMHMAWKAERQREVMVGLAGASAFLALPCLSFADEAPAMHTLRAKDSLGVAISYALTPPAVGQPSTLTLNTSSSAAAGAVSMTVRPDAGLALGSADLVANVAQPLQAAQTFRLTVTPAREGLYYLHVFLRAGARGRAMAIAVPVGDAKAGMNKDQHVLSVPSGGSVISVPAR